MLQLMNNSKNNIIVENLFIADSFWLRMKGLMWKKDLAEDEGLLLLPCNAVHMMFMRFPIDVIFLDRDFVVLKIMDNLKPWRFSPVVRGAFQVIELRTGTALKKGISIDDRLSLVRDNLAPCSTHKIEEKNSPSLV